MSELHVPTKCEIPIPHRDFAMYQSILVPLDGSRFSEHALPIALSLARGANARIHLVRAHMTLAPMYTETKANVEYVSDDFIRARERCYLAYVQKRLAESGQRGLDTALLDGPIADALNSKAKTSHAELIVMTTHGRGPLARMWLGSVADEVVRHSAVPVLLVRPQEQKADLSREVTFKHLLIALDGSPLAEEILAPAMSLGHVLGADFTLLRVVKPAVLGRYEPDEMGGKEIDQHIISQLEQLHAQEKRAAQDYLAGQASRLCNKGLKVQTRVVVHEQPAVAILDEVHAHRADCVALATHGHSGFPRLFLGSVADKVVRGATVPVLLYRPGQCSESK